MGNDFKVTEEQHALLKARAQANVEMHAARLRLTEFEQQLVESGLVFGTILELPAGPVPSW